MRYVLARPLGGPFFVVLPQQVGPGTANGLEVGIEAHALTRSPQAASGTPAGSLPGLRAGSLAGGLGAAVKQRGFCPQALNRKRHYVSLE